MVGLVGAFATSMPSRMPDDALLPFSLCQGTSIGCDRSSPQHSWMAFHEARRIWLLESCTGANLAGVRNDGGRWPVTITRAAPLRRRGSRHALGLPRLPRRSPNRRAHGPSSSGPPWAFATAKFTGSPVVGRRFWHRELVIHVHVEPSDRLESFGIARASKAVVARLPSFDSGVGKVRMDFSICAERGPEDPSS